MAVLAAYFGTQRVPLETQRAWAKEIRCYTPQVVDEAVRLLARTAQRPTLEHLLAAIDEAKANQAPDFRLKALPSTSTRDLSRTERKQRALAAKIVQLTMKRDLNEKLNGRALTPRERWKLSAELLAGWSDERCNGIFARWVDVHPDKQQEEIDRLNANLASLGRTDSDTVKTV